MKKTIKHGIILALLLVSMLPNVYASTPYADFYQDLGYIELTRGETKEISSWEVQYCYNVMEDVSATYVWETDPFVNPGFHVKYSYSDLSKVKIRGYAPCSNVTLYITLKYRQSNGQYYSTQFYYHVTVKNDSYTKLEKEIELAAPGTLSGRISYSDKNKITHLTLSGEINSDDLRFLREMAGCNENQGNLRYLDIRNVKFIMGESPFINVQGVDRVIYETGYNPPAYAFAFCYKLTEIWLPQNMTRLNKWALHYDDFLEKAHIPEGVTQIYENFQICPNLNSLEIPCTVTQIETDFSGCYRLNTIYCYASTPPTLKPDIPSNLRENGTLYVPKGTKNAYLAAPGWLSIANIYDTLDPIIKVESITLNKSSLDLVVGVEETLVATVLPDNATDKSVTWTSSKEEVATVSSSGVVTAHAVGWTYIYCKANDGSGKGTSCFVVVHDPVYPTSISISPETVSMKPTDTYKLSSSYKYPEGTQDVQKISPTKTWYSSNTNVVTVSDGELTAINPGTATITVKSENGLTATCVVTVIEPRVPLKMNIKQVSVGNEHTLILKTNGILWGCGLNGRGQLGDGTYTSTTTPKQLMTDVSAISTGFYHTMFLKTDGTLWSCGWNTHDQLGVAGIGIDCNTPVKVMSDVASVFAGGYHNIILKTDGTLWGCGFRYWGQLGDGDNTSYYCETPKRVMTDVTDVATVSAGGYHTMILKSDGSLLACGNNSYGQLCDGTTENRSTPVPVMTGVASVSAGSYHTMIVKTDGSLWACGRNNCGQLGDGTTNDCSIPKQVMTGVAAVAAGNNHTLILKTDGSLLACGVNTYGQLGDGTTEVRSIPTPVMDGVAVMEAGGYHTMFLKTDGSLWACGHNNYGQLGDGTIIDRYTPVLISEADQILVTSITLNKTSLSLQAGQVEKLTATVKPENATDKRVTWSSDNESVATVDSNGKVTAKAAGNATITCKANDGSGVSAACAVTVTSMPKLVLTASPSGGEVQAGTIVTLTVKADGNTINGCDIYYTLNGSTPTTGSPKYTSGIAINSDCTLKAIAYKDFFETSDMLTENYTIEKSYILTYLVDGQVYKTYELKAGETITPEPEPTKEGYTFSGWSEIPATMPAHDVTVTGSFTKGSYKLTYMVNGNVYKTLSYDYGDAITPEPAPTKDGYTFSGWSEIPATMPAHDVTVTGTFTANKYKLTYLVDGEVYKVYELEYGTVITPEPEPAKDGYTFSGWSWIPNKMPAEDVTVMGTFTPIKYKLTYMVDGEVYKVYMVDCGAVITPEPVPTKEGYTFSGWSWIPNKMPAEDVMVKGTFTVNVYKLTYIVDGAVYKSFELEYGTVITPEPAPTKDGYEFSGWSEIPATMPAHNVEVRGIFTYIDTAILNLMAEQGEVQIYAPNGKKLDRLQKGLNIVVMKDGTVKKVVVK
ncbi:MAG: Ig-like domain-containing protein [Prevotella sp.]|nr:Ig-like domain-containing protein [Prevotella sp.]